MNKFEAVILFSPDLSNPIIAKEEEKFNKIIDNLKGKMLEKENWGLKDLSYSINNFKKAFYKYYQLEINGSELKNIVEFSENIFQTRIRVGKPSKTVKSVEDYIFKPKYSLVKISYFIQC